jgi:hypothetical protein
MYTIEKYARLYYDTWNQFIAKSKNGTFLFHRDFMEYHKNRFEDFSLIVFEGAKPVALLPAHIIHNTVYSHSGLTYGGLIYDKKLKLPGVIKVVRVILQFLAEHKITKLNLKLVPPIYHTYPAQEINYILFVVNALLLRRDALSVIDLSLPVEIASNRMEGVKKAKKFNFEIVEEQDFRLFWDEVLSPNLLKKHNAKPVHTLKEITQLKAAFPENIKLFTVKKDNQVEAGTVLFESENVIHAQYISATADKNRSGSLDFLFYYLITKTFSHKKYFDFGISNEQQGTKLNEGLLFWKESFGARTVVQDFYEIDTSNYMLLDNVLI